MKRVEIMLRQAVLIFGLLTFAERQAEATAIGQLAGNLNRKQDYPGNTEISDFDQDGPLIDFTIEDGKLVVSCKGYYYIYGQAFFERHPDNRAAITVNSDPISLLQSVRQPDEATYGTRFTGTMKFLEEGDRIGFKAVYDSRFYMAPRHTFFGAYKIVGM